MGKGLKDHMGQKEKLTLLSHNKLITLEQDTK